MKKTHQVAKWRSVNLLEKGTKLVLLVLLANMWGCATNPVTGDRELRLISREEEIAMGQDAAPVFEEEFGGRVDDAEVQSYVSEVGQRVAQHADREMPYEFVLVASEVPNAFALPGGKIYITAGLMERMENERQLAAVLGHEIGHVAALHNVQHLQRQMGASILANVAKVAGGSEYGTIAEVGAKVTSGMVNLRYSRGDEYQSDQLGIRYMTRAGYNPWGMVELLTVLYNLHEQEPSRFTEMFQTHPLASKRIEEARETVEDDYEDYAADDPDPNKDRFVKMRRRL